jgi:predicted nucleic acid-binding protein
LKYLLDTCTISEPTKGRPNHAVMAWLDGCDEDSLFLSVLTIGEIQKGITKVKDERRRSALQRWLDKDLRERFAGRILAVSAEVALTWGIIEGEAESNGTPLPVIDGLIAATAIAHNLTVATRNIDDIEHTGARVLNPWVL